MSGINASAAKARSAGVLAAGGVGADCAGCSALGNGGLTASASSEVSRILRRMASRFISATARAYPPLATPWAILTGIACSKRRQVDQPVLPSRHRNPRTSCAGHKMLLRSQDVGAEDTKHLHCRVGTHTRTRD